MKIFIQIVVVLLTLSQAPIIHAKKFYIDPMKGNIAGDGSANNPWKTLEEVINSRLIETKDVLGTFVNQGAPIKAGDTIVLKSGYHGFIQIKNAFNDNYITVTPAYNEKPIISGLDIISAKNWKFSRLTISPVFSAIGIKSNSIVTIGENNYLGDTSNIYLTDSSIYSFSEAPETLTSADWIAKAKTAVTMGRNAKNLYVINNYINNVSFGINMISPYSRIQNNIITDFCMDGIRAVANNIVVEDNVIKNNYVIDANHPDGIQGFSFNPQMTLANVSVIGNIVLNRDKKINLVAGNLPVNSYSETLQGIGFFDGPVTNIQIKNNIVMSFSWQGIGLYDSINGQIVNNTVYTPPQITNAISKLTLGSKITNGNVNNTITNNVANEYSFQNSIGLMSSVNTRIIAGNDKLFRAGLITRLSEINSKYGKYHPVVNKPRVDDNFISIGIASIF